MDSLQSDFPGSHPHRHTPTELTYGICGTQTHHALEDMVARIEGGTRCQITSSGLSACTVALLAFLKAGDHCLLPDSVYGPVRSFADGFLRRFGVEVEFYHASATVAELEGHFKDNTRVLYIESPGQSLRVAGIDWECTYMMPPSSV